MTTHDPALVELVYRTLGSLFRGQADQRDARAVLDAITTSPRHALVELPRGNADWRSVDWQPGTGWDLAAYKGQVHIDEASNEPLSPDAAVSIAAALLAAAKAAESGSTTPETKEN